MKRPSIEPFCGGGVPFLVDETEECFFVYKPAGMHSAPSGRNRSEGGGAGGNADGGESLVKWFRFVASGASDSAASSGAARADRFDVECGMLSRLDRETSGLVPFARSPDAFARLLKLQADGKFSKRYGLRADRSPGELAGSLPLRSDLEPRGGTIVESRFRSYGPRGAMVACVKRGMEDLAHRRLSALHATEILRTRILPDAVAVSPGGLEAEVCIHSGFRHQIRAHMAWMGWPIRGDFLYGGRAADRMYLEAYNIEYFDIHGELIVVDMYGR